MKILLVAVNSKYIHSNPAVYSLKSCIGEYESFVEVAEFTINQQRSYILQEIYKRHPKVVAFSCYIWNRQIMDGIIPDLHKILPEADIWAGGPEVSYDAEEAIEKWKLRGVMKGAGEGSFLHLVSAYVNGGAGSLPTILDSRNTPHLPLDEIPFWHEDMTGFEHRVIYYESSRGCPFSCSYCLSSIEKHMDFRSVERVCRELDFFLGRQAAQVKFVDRTFNCKKEHALPILKHILEHDNGITNFHFEVAADILDEDYFEVLEGMRPGAVQLEIGVQSTCEDSIAEIHRKMDFAKVAAAVERISSWNNIHIHLDLIAGLPFEDLGTFQNSFNEVYRLRPEQLQLGFLKVLKGSDMERYASRYGLIYTDLPPYEVLSTKWLSYEEICHLKQVEEVLELYYNSNQFVYTLEFLGRYFDTPYAMYDALAAWYEEHDLFGIQSSRIKKYEILLEFGVACIGSSASVCGKAICGLWQSPLCREDSPKTEIFMQQKDCHLEDLAETGQEISSDASLKDWKECAILKEYILYDLYLREHMKNRPPFVGSLERWKDRIHDILHEESRLHTLFPELSGCNYRELTKVLHVEVFEHIFGETQAVLFCYERRDALTNNCMVAKVPIVSKYP